ncbi:uncharacterized protein LOC112569519 [Pomacea canaliculata]|uniref:uncharacterized protein LOC112569519 n=1 Tax=Pomacea canaliculata TaxID=400727 RepID=UPI000D72F910|nr:uncharacterized protein LOC112569519 [Pomacea canaliculata]
MEVLGLCLLMIFLTTRGLAQMAGSTCTATNERTIKCMFPENVNEAQNDFSLFFISDGGAEELLVECTWMESEFYCITQEGFELREPLSDIAEITIPTKFLDKKGSYQCIFDRYARDSFMPCRLPDRQEFVPELLADSKRFSTCEIKAELEAHQFILKCIFSSDIETFSVICNSALVVKYTRSSCQSSSVCHNFLEDNNHVFSVRLNTSEQAHSEYLCQPDDVFFEVHGCSAAVEKHAEASRAPSVVIILSFVCVMCLVSTVWPLSTYA